MNKLAKLVILLGACLVPLLSAICPAAAQTASVGDFRLPRGFVGAGMALSASDAAFRMRLFDDPSPSGWIIEAGFSISPRIGFGIELTAPSPVVATTTGKSFNASGRQEERVLLGLLRYRVAGSPRWGMDLVGGAGVLFQRHERRLAPCFTGCAVTIDETFEEKAPAFVIGVDVPFFVASHFAVSPFGRLYILRRDEYVPRPGFILPWQYDVNASNRIAAGVTGRFTW